MSLVSLLLQRDTPGRIGDIELDATISENHNFTNQITQWPVEDGSIMTDHVLSQPENLTLNGFVTNSPISNLPPLLSPFGSIASSVSGGIATVQSLLGKSRTETAFNDLLELWEGKKNLVGEITRPLITIVTGLKVYKNMIMVSLVVPRDKDTRDALHFTATFQKIKKVSSKIVPTEDLKLQPLTDSSVSAGKQTATTATQAEIDEGSILYQAGEIIAPSPKK